MQKVRKIFRRGIVSGWEFFCPACNCMHTVENTKHRLVSKDETAPTLSPEIRNTNCVVAVRDGFLEYYRESKHSLSGQVVPMTSLTSE